MHRSSTTQKVAAVVPAAQSRSPASLQRRTVSRPRQKGVQKVKLNFNVPQTMREKLEMAAQRHDSSLSDLLSGAVARCLKDDVWNTRIRAAISRDRTIVPPAELVDISNRLVELGFLLEQLINKSTNTNLADEATRIYLDARVHLARLCEEHGC